MPYRAYKGPSGALEPLVWYQGGVTRVTSLHSTPGSIDVRATDDAWGYTNGTGFNTGNGNIFSAVAGVKTAFSAHLFACAIPNGVTIASASFSAFGRSTLNWANVNDMTLGAEQIDNADIITAANYVATHDDVGTTILWNPAGGIGSVSSGGTIAGADIASVIQQIVNRAGWVSGNNIQILITTPGSNPADYSWHDHTNATAGLRPRLQVSWT